MTSHCNLPIFTVKEVLTKNSSGIEVNFCPLERKSPGKRFEGVEQEGMSSGISKRYLRDKHSSDTLSKEVVPISLY